MACERRNTAQRFEPDGLNLDWGTARDSCERQTSIIKLDPNVTLDANCNPESKPQTRVLLRESWLNSREFGIVLMGAGALISSGRKIRALTTNKANRNIKTTINGAIY